MAQYYVEDDLRAIESTKYFGKQSSTVNGAAGTRHYVPPSLLHLRGRVYTLFRNPEMSRYGWEERKIFTLEQSESLKIRYMNHAQLSPKLSPSSDNGIPSANKCMEFLNNCFANETPHFFADSSTYSYMMTREHNFRFAAVSVFGDDGKRCIYMKKATRFEHQDFSAFAEEIPAVADTPMRGISYRVDRPSIRVISGSTLMTQEFQFKLGMSSENDGLWLPEKSDYNYIKRSDLVELKTLSINVFNRNRKEERKISNAFNGNFNPYYYEEIILPRWTSYCILRGIDKIICVVQHNSVPKEMLLLNINEVMRRLEDRTRRLFPDDIGPRNRPGQIEIVPPLHTWRVWTRELALERLADILRVVHQRFENAPDQGQIVKYFSLPTNSNLPQEVNDLAAYNALDY